MPLDACNWVLSGSCHFLGHTINATVCANHETMRLVQTFRFASHIGRCSGTLFDFAVMTFFRQELQRELSSPEWDQKVFADLASMIKSEEAAMAKGRLAVRALEFYFIHQSCDSLSVLT